MLTRGRWRPTRAGVAVFSVDEVLSGAPPLPEFALPLAELCEGVG